LGQSVSSASFLQSEINMNDPAVLRKRIAELEAENKRLKEQDSTSSSTASKGFNTMRQGAGVAA
jgi:hypothetical protein